MVRVARLERAVSWSQTRRDTNFATPGYFAAEAFLLYSEKGTLSNLYCLKIRITANAFYIKLTAEAVHMKLLEERARAKEEIKRRDERAAEIRSALARLAEEMERTEQLFNLTADENLLEAYIYERNAQSARMNYLCRLAKEL